MMICFAICTYNRAPFLRLLLEDFKQEYENFLKTASLANFAESNEISKNNLKIKILLIDNNSTDETKIICKSFIDDFKSLTLTDEQNKTIPQCELKYLFENKQGLSHARNAAIHEFLSESSSPIDTSREYLIFLDDDIRLNQGFLRSLVKNIIEKSNEFLASVRIIPAWENGEPPKWIKLSPPFAISPSVFPSHDYGETSQQYPFQYQGLQVSNPIGAVFLISRESLIKLGLFNTKLGVGSSPKESGFGLHEDTEFFRLALNNHIPIYYWGDISVTHPVSKLRSSEEYIYSWYFKSGKSLTWLAFNRPELFNHEQAEMIGCPHKLIKLIPPPIKIFLKIKINSVPLYLRIKSYILKLLCSLSILFLNTPLAVWLKALEMKCRGEIQAFQELVIELI